MEKKIKTPVDILCEELAGWGCPGLVGDHIFPCEIRKKCKSGPKKSKECWEKYAYKYTSE
jgi:hypothetical protein